MKFIFCISLFFLLSACTTTTQNPFQLQVVRNWSQQTTLIEYVGPKLVNTSSPVVDEKYIFQGNAFDGFLALNRNNGRIVWRLNIKNGVTSGATLIGDKVLFAGNDGQFYCVKKNSGQIIWTYPTQSEVLSKPTVDGGRVYFLTAAGNLVSLDLETGKINWAYFQRDNSNLNIRASSSPVVDGNLVFVGFSDGTVSALDKNTGFLKWDRNLAGAKDKFRDLDSKPIIDGQILYISNYEGGLFALNKNNGEILWKTERGSSSQALLFDNRIYYPTTDGHVVALDKASGKELWAYKVKRGVATAVSYYKELLIFGTSEGALEIIDTKGRFIDEYNTGWGISAPVSISEKNNELFFISNYGNIYSVKLNWIRKVKSWPWENI